MAFYEGPRPWMITDIFAGSGSAAFYVEGVNCYDKGRTFFWGTNGHDLSGYDLKALNGQQLLEFIMLGEAPIYNRPETVSNQLSRARHKYVNPRV